MARSLRPLLLGATAVVLAVILTLGAALALGGGSGSEDTGAPGTAGRAAPGIDPAAIADSDKLVASLQARLKVTPKDHRSWSTLVSAYVEQARVTADPSYYSKADGALSRASRLAPRDSVMLTARAYLAAARHNFTDALAAADEALKVNPYSAPAEAVRADALTELGRYDDALAAATHADELDPGPATFARLSYQSELRGDLREATRLMQMSKDAAGRSASSYAFAAYHLGELARAEGEPGAAARHYDDAIAADPSFLPALAGRARLAVARGEVAAAEADYLRVVRGLPLVEYLVELGELYEATGRPVLAKEQYAVATASATLAAASGVVTDLETALFEADHGSPAAALTAAKAEFDRRESVHTADALAWALHAAGRDREALRYTRLATRLGTRDARFLFHRGAIEAALDLPAAAGHLRAARALDAGVSPWREQAITALLDGGR